MFAENTSNLVRVWGVSFYYGWVIVSVCIITMAIAYGVMYSFSVFFKPIVAYFNWDRATVASIYSLAMVFRGAVSIHIHVRSSLMSIWVWLKAISASPDSGPSKIKSQLSLYFQQVSLQIKEIYIF